MIGPPRKNVENTPLLIGMHLYNKLIYDIDLILSKTLAIPSIVMYIVYVLYIMLYCIINL